MAVEQRPLQSPISAPRPGLGPESVRPEHPMPAREKWGYAVWGTIVVFILVMELLAAFSHGLGFPTVSKTVGDLERRHHWVKVVMLGGFVTLTARIVFYPWPNRRTDT
jgi:hypothetical protein